MEKVSLKYLVSLLEKNYNKKIKKKYKPLQFGDVKKTFSNTSKIKKYVGKLKVTRFEDGIKNFCTWYKKYYL